MMMHIKGRIRSQGHPIKMQIAKRLTECENEKCVGRIRVVVDTDILIH